MFPVRCPLRHIAAGREAPVLLIGAIMDSGDRFPRAKRTVPPGTAQAKVSACGRRPSRQAVTLTDLGVDGNQQLGH